MRGTSELPGPLAASSPKNEHQPIERRAASMRHVLATLECFSDRYLKEIRQHFKRAKRICEFSNIAGSTRSHCYFIEYFSVEDMDSIFPKYLLLGLAAALVALIIAPNSASAIPLGVVENAANALSQAFGRNERNSEE
ncbi:hypothetical protein MRX96_039824 [Rhipicephalus microplus]